jgi:hypothetical protein
MKEKKETLEHLLSWMQKLRLTLRSIGMPPLFAKFLLDLSLWLNALIILIHMSNQLTDPLF